MSGLKARLRAIFDATTSPVGAGRRDGYVANSHRRYVARSLSGGPGWGVFDKHEQRFLSDKEVLAIEDVEETIQ